MVVMIISVMKKIISKHELLLMPVMAIMMMITIVVVIVQITQLS